jgi:hypothetical protein
LTNCLCKSPNIDPDVAQGYVKAHWDTVVINFFRLETLFQCPTTRQYWKEFHPHPEAQANGPPDYRPITAEEAKRDFGHSSA